MIAPLLLKKAALIFWAQVGNIMGYNDEKICKNELYGGIHKDLRHSHK